MEKQRQQKHKDKVFLQTLTEQNLVKEPKKTQQRNLKNLKGIQHLPKQN